MRLPDEPRQLRLPAAFIEALLTEPEFRRELEDEDRRKWHDFTLRPLVWDGESEELPAVSA